MVEPNQRSVADELSIICKSLVGWYDEDDLFPIKRIYAHWFLFKATLIFPEGVYRYTRLFITAVACLIAQAVGHRPSIRYWKYQTNEQVIAVASHSLNTMVYLVGWASGRFGLLLHSILRLGTRALRVSNESRLLSGYDIVVDKGSFPFHLHAFSSSIWRRATTIYRCAQLTIAYFAQHIVAKVGWKSGSVYLKGVIRNSAGELVKGVLDIPFHEVEMMSTSIAYSILFRISNISRWAVTSRWVNLPFTPD